ncbi:hypothetical protein LSCM4_05160 [Leishmania orientalis]|uniref:Ankyrin repeat protein n=1 Tax=Leishmania orientalis TaxID=2249476 RepID=A0A836HG31_9TRYP|nr:hypothetical protein LSCM4_05160 [Leishmania orientalis]
MRGAFGASRLLRRFLPSKDVEALLQSVLEHHTAQEESSMIVSTLAIPPGHGDEGVPPSLGSLSCLRRNPDNDTTDLRALEETGIAFAAGGGVRKEPPGLAGVLPTSPRQQESDFFGVRAGQRKSLDVPADQKYFTLKTVRANPMISFPEILRQWEHLVALEGQQGTDYISLHLPCSETGLLNLKLEDGVLASLAAMCGTPPSIDKVPKHVVDVLKSDFRVGDTREASSDAGGFRAPFLHRTPKSPICYTLLHFSAELGDVAYVQALLTHYPSGFPLRWLSSPMRAGLDYPAPTMDDREERAGGMCFQLFPPLSAPAAAMASELGTNVYAWANAELYPCKWVAEHCPDHTGMYLCHLAAARGNVQYLDYLVGLLGATTVLSRQRCSPPASPRNTWGPLRYLPLLSATQCALAFHQITVLEWIEVVHPFALEKMERKTLLHALVAAAIHKDDLTGAFSFLRTRSMEPLSMLDTVSASASVRASREKVGASKLSQRMCSPELEEAGIFHIVFAAAEAGNVGVLHWFDGALGDTDLRRLCDQRGATVLHHCARCSRAAAMATLLPVATATSGTGSLQRQGEAPWSPPRWTPLDPAWIDVEDSDGRTPAVWCVVGRAKKGGATEVLEVLRNAGSDWPRRRHNGLSLFEIAAQQHSRHTKLMRYLKCHIQISMQSKGRADRVNCRFSFPTQTSLTPRFPHLLHARTTKAS